MCATTDGNPDTATQSPTEKFSEGVKFDQGKVRTDLLDPLAMEGTAEVLGKGAIKYEDRNWEKGMKWSRPYGALLRHLFAFWRGEDIDPETGLYHIDQVGCNAMFLQRYFRTHKEWDDRPNSPTTPPQT